MRCLLVAALPVVGAAHAPAEEWQVDRAARDNRVRFTSTVSTFSFSGETDQIDGYAYWQGTGLLAPDNEVLFTVALDGLDTGIGKRDRDMREVLATDRWPAATFKGRVTSHEPTDSSAATYRVTASGTMTLHGVTHPLEVSGTAVFGPDQARVTAAFAVQLAEYGIEAPSLAAFIKVNQAIAVSVSFSLKRAATKGTQP